MKEALMERLKIFLHREDNSTLVGIPASQKEIAKAQQQLNVNFHEDYVHFIKTFGGADATFVSTSTSNYNCHSYAWYSDSTSNTYWMNDPSRYMTDGSYSSFTNLINAGSGTRVYYDNGEHSGIVYEAGGPLASTKKLKVISKWGMAPLMKHRAEYSPYASDNLTMWKKN
ncbi:SMI1/KNR4 family protein [Paenibacillus sp.]|jgi:hypothetical protein|uniref:SMI1/KNR4 family protein n=1 Tax=Paenibacillus sp. TaxID=58172 RepID=UPI00281A0F9D|nr:SMI1/KNR4 family protein [Paenibacillus sp.]MDR0267294.1 SMI1/KNR4 family protein [Paenibacillus sp.]